MNFFRNSFVALIFSFSILSISYFFGDFFQFSYIKMISWRFILFLIMATGIA
ncbi:ABC transporter permease, partial [Borreliella burgdorferi]|nr:ABC transporter permease [Borreliella burgdorferi]